MATTYATARKLMAPYVDNGVSSGDVARIDERIDEAQRRLISHYNFVSRREEAEPLWATSGLPREPLVWRAGGTTGDPANGYLILDNIDATKNMILALWREENNALEMSQTLETKANAYIERDLMAEVERGRKDRFQSLAAIKGQNTFGGMVGRVGLETAAQYTLPESRLRSLVNQAYQEALDQRNFTTRREDNEAALITFTPLSFDSESFAWDGAAGVLSGDIIRLLVLSLLATNSGADGSGLKKQAFDLIERDVMAGIERTRRETTGAIGQLHNELPEGVRFSTGRLTEFYDRSAIDAQSHWDFVARREDYRPSTVLGSFRVECVTTPTFSGDYVPSGSMVDGKNTYVSPATDFIFKWSVANNRWEATSPSAALSSDSPVPLPFPPGGEQPSEHPSQLSWGSFVTITMLGQQPEFPYETRKKYVESYIATIAGQSDVSANLKQMAEQLVEKQLIELIEAQRTIEPGTLGRLHNELQDGVKIPTARLEIYVDQAETDIAAHQASIQRREDYSGSTPAPTFEQIKLLVEAYIATSRGAVDVATAAKQLAFGAVERDVVTDIETARRVTRQALQSTDPLSFGYHWGRIGLELPDALKLSDSAVKRLTQSAEEQLMATGKWVGTVAEYTLAVSATGEFTLPREIETILFMSFDGNPRSVKDRLNEWLSGGPGLREDDNWRESAVDRGEVIDGDGFAVRKYFITLPNTVPVVRVLAKRRFIPHEDAGLMFLRNYQAIYEAAKGLLLGGDQITPQMDKAKELLTSQLTQQNFQGNRGSAHRRRIVALR